MISIGPNRIHQYTSRCLSASKRTTFVQSEVLQVCNFTNGFGYHKIERRSFSNATGLYKDGRGHDGGKNTRRQRERIFRGTRIRRVRARRRLGDASDRGALLNATGQGQITSTKKLPRSLQNQEELLEVVEKVNIDRRWTPSSSRDSAHTNHESVGRNGDRTGNGDNRVNPVPNSIKNEHEQSAGDIGHTVTSQPPLAGYTNDVEKTFNPFSNRGKTELAAMIADLEEMTSNSNSKPRKLTERGQEAVAAGLGSINFPIHSFSSPIERRVDTLQNRKDPKRRASIEEADVQLSKVPWAQMLSGPVRLDSGAKVRMPKSLMTSWGIVREPQSSHDYLMPIEASDLDALKLQLTPQTHQTSQPRLTKPIDGERLYIQPNGLLIRAISNELIKKPKDPSKIPATVSSLLVNSLIPFRWRNVISRAEAYKRTQFTVDETTGKESPDVKWKENVPNFRAINWQPDIYARLKLIFGERLMTALDGLANNNNAATAIRAKRVSAMDMPENGRLTLEQQSVVHEDAHHTIRGKTSAQTVDASRVPRWHPGSIFLHVGSPQQYAHRISTWHEQREGNGQTASDVDYLPPLPENPLIPPMITLTASNDQTCPRIVRLPMFNLVTLLGPAYSARVHQTLSQHGIFNRDFWTNVEAEALALLQRKSQKKALATDSPLYTTGQSSSITQSARKISEDDEGDPEMLAFLDEQARLLHQDSPLVTNDSTQDKEYVILVKSTAVKSQEFADEIWQLWRYIRGKEGLWLGEEDGDELKSVEQEKEGP